MPTTLFCQHPELPSIQQYFQTFNRKTLTSNAHLTASLHTPQKPKQPHATPCNHPSETIHQLWKPDQLPHIPQKSKPLCLSAIELQIGIWEKQAELSSFPKENPFIIPYHWPHHKFRCPSCQGYVTEQPFSSFIYLWSQLFLFQTLCLCMQKHIYFFNSYVIKENQPYP